MSNTYNEILVVGGDNGTGKSEFAIKMSGEFFEEGISTTTRNPRLKDDGTMETHGKEYYFVEKKDFNKEAYLEYTEIKDGEGGSTFYATAADELVRIWEKGKIPILVLDPAGIKACSEKDFNTTAKEILEDYFKKSGTKGFNTFSCILDIEKAEVFNSLVPKYGKSVSMARMKRGTIREEIKNMKLIENSDFSSGSYKETDALYSMILSSFHDNKKISLSSLSSKKKAKPSTKVFNVVKPLK